MQEAADEPDCVKTRFYRCMAMFSQPPRSLKRQIEEGLKWWATTTVGSHEVLHSMSGGRYAAVNRA